MSPVDDLDTNELWRRVGLEELRASIRKVESASREFERILRELPPCNRCARASLLRQIQDSGAHLSSKSGSISALAAVVKESVEQFEIELENFESETISECACSSGPCTCHD